LRSLILAVHGDVWFTSVIKSPLLLLLLSMVARSGDLGGLPRPSRLLLILTAGRPD